MGARLIHINLKQVDDSISNPTLSVVNCILDLFVINIGYNSDGNYSTNTNYNWRSNDRRTGNSSNSQPADN